VLGGCFFLCWFGGGGGRAGGEGRHNDCAISARVGVRVGRVRRRRGHVPGAEGDDLRWGAVAVAGGHLAHHDGAALEVLGALPPAERLELVGVQVPVWEAVGVDWVERRGPDQDGRHGLEIGFAC
jgi:hypothetical protein